MRYVIAEGGQIVDVRDLDPAFVQALRDNNNPKASRIFDIIEAERPADSASQIARESFTFNGSVYQQVWTLVARAVPTITAFQLRAAIRGINRRAEFISYIKQTATAADQDYWETSPTFNRTDPEIERMRVALGVTQNAVTNLFYSAAAF